MQRLSQSSAYFFANIAVLMVVTSALDMPSLIENIEAPFFNTSATILVPECCVYKRTQRR